jgi:UDP-2,3-diacylglucosamine hydrolase
MNQKITIALEDNKKIYFASDLHLGAPNHAQSLIRERKFIAWLDAIKADAQVICLVGDLFDFWFEYKKTVPRGFVRFLGKLGELSDAGIEIMVFPGNHDLWMTDYFETELGIKTYRKPLKLEVKKATKEEGNTQSSTISFYVTHGDGLGPGDYWYKALKVIFESKLARWAFGNLLHPNWSLALGQAWANHSWQKHEKEEAPTFLGEDKEWLLLYAKEIENQQHNDYYVFGHRHILLHYAITNSSQIVILGDWIQHFSYGVFDGERFDLEKI